MNEDTPELMEKINAMNLDELLAYNNAAKNTNNFINFAGVGLCFLILIYMNVLLIGVGGIILYFLGKLSIGVGSTRIILQERILKLAKEQGKI
jgi:hypothetical protein